MGGTEPGTYELKEIDNERCKKKDKWFTELLYLTNYIHLIHGGICAAASRL